MSVFSTGLAKNHFDIYDLEEDQCQPLANIITGVMLPEPVTAHLVAAKDIGRFT
jgi:hypothetical protein